MTLPKFQSLALARSDKYGDPAMGRYRLDRFSLPSNNRSAARKGDNTVPTGPVESHCRDDRQDAP